MKQLLLLPYLITTLVMYTKFVLSLFQPGMLVYPAIAHALWFVITITGLAVALVAKEW